MALAVDRPFFDAIGGPSASPSHDLGDGDCELQRDDGSQFTLTRGHWEVLTLEESSDKLLAAETIKKDEFEETLRTKLEPLESAPLAGRVAPVDR